MTTSSETKSGCGGFWMLLALVLMLGLPPVIGHFVLQPAESAASIHADAAQ